MTVTLDKKLSRIETFFSTLSTDKIMKSIFSFMTKTKTEKPKVKHVDIVIVNDSIYSGSMRQIYNDEKVTVYYDRDNLDSMYALSFFDFIHCGNIKAISYQQCSDKKIVIHESDKVIILGVDISFEDLFIINKNSKETVIYGYRGAFDYLYEPTYQKLFTNVTLYQSDNDYYIGGKGASLLENSMAMMIKILYSKTDDWGYGPNVWALSKYATAVAHHNCFHENIPAYDLTKSTITVSHNETDGKNKASIKNENDIRMFDLKIKLETYIENKVNIPNSFQVDIKEDEYNNFRKRIQMHIERTRLLQGWIGKELFDAEKQYGYCIPAIGFAVHDLVALSSNNVDTTVCIEDLGDRKIYYIYSKTKGKAVSVARVLNGEKTWMKGHLVCTSKLKNSQDRR